MKSDLTEVNVSAEITLSTLAELNGESVQDGELDLAFINDIGGDLAILSGGVDLDLVVELATVGSGTLELVGFEGSVNVVIRQDVVRGTKTGERRKFQ